MSKQRRFDLGASEVGVDKHAIVEGLMRRPYQDEIIAQVLETFNGTNRISMVSETGSGKTKIASEIANHFDKVLWLAHRTELLDQADTALIDHKNATVRSIFKSPPGGLFDLVVLDESHHAPAETVRNLLDKLSFSKLLGLTATPNRLDQQHLGFDTTIYGVPLDVLVNQGYLVPVDLYTIRAAGNKDFELIEWLYTWGERLGKTIIFVTRREQAEFYKAALSPAFKVETILQDSNRKAILEKYRNGNVDMLVSCQVLTEGIDLPCTSSIILARQTESLTLLQQMVGRGLRPYDNKDHCKVVEVISLLSKNKQSIGEAITPRSHFIISHRGNEWKMNQLPY